LTLEESTPRFCASEAEIASVVALVVDSELVDVVLDTEIASERTTTASAARAAGDEENDAPGEITTVLDGVIDADLVVEPVLEGETVGVCVGVPVSVEVREGLLVTVLVTSADADAVAVLVLMADVDAVAVAELVDVAVAVLVALAEADAVAVAVAVGIAERDARAEADTELVSESEVPLERVDVTEPVEVIEASAEGVATTDTDWVLDHAVPVILGELVADAELETVLDEFAVAELMDEATGVCEKPETVAKGVVEIVALGENEETADAEPTDAVADAVAFAVSVAPPVAVAAAVDVAWSEAVRVPVAALDAVGVNSAENDEVAAPDAVTVPTAVDDEVDEAERGVGAEFEPVASALRDCVRVMALEAAEAELVGDAADTVAAAEVEAVAVTDGEVVTDPDVVPVTEPETEDDDEGVTVFVAVLVVVRDPALEIVPDDVEVEVTELHDETVEVADDVEDTEALEDTEGDSVGTLVSVEKAETDTVDTGVPEDCADAVVNGFVAVAFAEAVLVAWAETVISDEAVAVPVTDTVTVVVIDGDDVPVAEKVTVADTGFVMELVIVLVNEVWALTDGIDETVVSAVVDVVTEGVLVAVTGVAGAIENDEVTVAEADSV